MINDHISPSSPGPDPVSTLSKQGPVSFCVCDYPIVAEVFSKKHDEIFCFYRRCPEHSQVKHIMEVETLSELKGLGHLNLTEAGKKWLEEMEEKENHSGGSTC